MPKSLQRCVTSLSVSSKVPSSSRKSMRSRADILPSLCCRSRRCAPPPSSANWSRRFSSAIFSSSFIGRHYRRGLFCDTSKPLPQGAQRKPTGVVWFPPFLVRDETCVSRSRGGGVKQIQEFYFLLCGQERRLEGIAGQFSQVFVGEAECLLHERVLLDQRCSKHRGIVGVEGQHQALVEVAPHGMLRE